MLGGGNHLTSMGTSGELFNVIETKEMLHSVNIHLITFRVDKTDLRKPLS